MPTVSEIYNFIDTLAPFRIQDSFDNSGLCVGCIDDPAEIKKVLLSLDATVDVVEEAKRLDCQLILTHHPVIFNAVKHLDLTFPYARALAAGIFCIGVHTCLDSAEYSVSDMMVDALGFKNLHIIPEINRVDPLTGRPVGYGAMAECLAMSPNALSALARKTFGSAALRYVDGGRIITKVSCGSGACSSILSRAYSLGAQAVITADVKLDVFLEASRLGMTLIDAGHYETEAIALPYLAKKLSEKFGVECILSTTDRVVKGLYSI